MICCASSMVGGIPKKQQQRKLETSFPHEAPLHPLSLLAGRISSLILILQVVLELSTLLIFALVDGSV